MVYAEGLFLQDNQITVLFRVQTKSAFAEWLTLKDNRFNSLAYYVIPPKLKSFDSKYKYIN